MQDLGDQLRCKEPAGTVSAIIEEIRHNDTNVVVECFRNPAEVIAFRDAFGYQFYLFAIDAKTETRWSRLKDLYGGDRGKFNENDLRDAEDKKNPYGQNVDRCMSMADILINSNENFYHISGEKDIKVIDSYGQNLSDYFDLIKSPGMRPPTDNELFMHHACSVATMSTCSHRRVGAIIVKNSSKKVLPERNGKQEKSILNNYVISTGANNVPSGLRSCALKYKEKCYRDNIKTKGYAELKFCRLCGQKLLAEQNFKCVSGCDNKRILGGKLLDICRALHAEENAILQAAKLGSTSLDKTVLYSSAFPCMLCAKKIIEVGIKKVVFLEAYPMGESQAHEMLESSGVIVEKFEGVNYLAFARMFNKTF